ncbi:unnamed protein product, partial [Symbiodinium pilosum]
ATRPPAAGTAPAAKIDSPGPSAQAPSMVLDHKQRTAEASQPAKIAESPGSSAETASTELDHKQRAAEEIRQLQQWLLGGHMWKTGSLF